MIDKTDPNKALILGVGVSGTPMDQVLGILEERMANKTYNKPFFVVTVNSEFLVQAQEDEEFKEILNRADLAIPDGVGLSLAGAKHIVPGRKLVEFLVKVNSNSKRRTFYLGGRNWVAREMASKYGGKWDEGEKSIRAGERERVRIIDKINKYKPDLLLVAYGAPWQEKWLAANGYKLKAKVMMGVGGAFDYLTGRAKLPPSFLSGVGMEWLWRLIHEPWRWRRQLRLLKYLWLIMARG